MKLNERKMPKRDVGGGGRQNTRIRQIRALWKKVEKKIKGVMNTIGTYTQENTVNVERQ